MALIATIPGVALGIFAGLSRWGGLVVMRLVDMMMAIPAVLLAIALAALLEPGLTTVIIAIAVPEIPRMIRLVRSVVLSVREQPFVDAAISVGTGGLPLVMRHVLPNTVAPVIVQSTYAAASAIIAAAILSFLGVGTSTEVPSWGGMMADARKYFQFHPKLMGLSRHAAVAARPGDQHSRRPTVRCARSPQGNTKGRPMNAGNDKAKPVLKVDGLSIAFGRGAGRLQALDGVCPVGPAG